MPIKRTLMLTMLAAGLALPAAAQTRPEAEAMVKKAIAFAAAQGTGKALAEISKPGGSFTKGPLYVFVYDLEGKVRAHGQNPKLVGMDMLDATDPDGVPYVKNRIALVKAKGNGWQDYKFSNPVTKKIEAKTAYVELHEGLIYGCGIYK
jgi:signal transduction histidine kinase